MAELDKRTCNNGNCKRRIAILQQEKNPKLFCTKCLQTKKQQNAQPVGGTQRFKEYSRGEREDFKEIQRQLDIQKYMYETTEIKLKEEIEQLEKVNDYLTREKEDLQEMYGDTLDHNKEVVDECIFKLEEELRNEVFRNEVLQQEIETLKKSIEELQKENEEMKKEKESEVKAKKKVNKVKKKVSTIKKKVGKK